MAGSLTESPMQAYRPTVLPPSDLCVLRVFAVLSSLFTLFSVPSVPPCFHPVIFVPLSPPRRSRPSVSPTLNTPSPSHRLSDTHPKMPASRSRCTRTPPPDPPRWRNCSSPGDCHRHQPDAR